VRFIEPMLASLVDSPPEGDQWLHELKYDGYRTELTFDGHDWCGYARRGVWNAGFHDWYKSYAPSALSYKLSRVTRGALRIAIDVTLAPPPPEQRLGSKIVKYRFPRRVGKLRSAPEH
jgi:hypothetical protein